MRGFTLIELLIVIAIILIIAAMAIPNLLHSRSTINSAEVSYHSAYPTHGYAAQLSDLGGSTPCNSSPTSACLIDNLLARGVKSGYNFAAPGTNRDANGIYMDYTAGAAPTMYDKSGVRRFCSLSDGIIRYDANVSQSTTPPDLTQCQPAAPLE